MKRLRPLTAAETALAHSLYGEGIDYARVRIGAGAWWLPPGNIAMAPCGHIYFPAAACPADFAAVNTATQAWFIHEMAHVWQYQNGFPVWLGGIWLAICGAYRRQRAYRLPVLAHTASLGDLNMEQQAELLRLAFLYRCRGQELPADMQRLLQPFFEHPHNRTLLPPLCPSTRLRAA